MMGGPDDEGHKTMGSPNWAPTPCQPVQFANWVCQHSWQRVATENLVPKCFPAKMLDLNLGKVAGILECVEMLVKNSVKLKWEYTYQNLEKIHLR